MDSKNRAQESYTVLIVNNWRFVKDLDPDLRAPTCQLKDWNIEIKISSTTFKNPQSQREPYRSNDNTPLWFDKNGVVMSYPAFMGLLKHAQFRDYVAEVALSYQYFQEQSTNIHQETFNQRPEYNDEEEEEEEEEEGRQDIERVDEEEGEEEEEEGEQSGKRKRGKTPSEVKRQLFKTPKNSRKRSAAASKAVAAPAKKNARRTSFRDAHLEDVQNSNDPTLSPSDLEDPPSSC